jgi:hypothetical protein
MTSNHPSPHLILLSSLIWDKHHPKFLFIINFYFLHSLATSVSIPLKYFISFYFIKWLTGWMKMWVSAFRLLLICKDSSIWLHVPIFYCFGYCTRFNSMNIWPLIHTSLPQMGIWGISSLLKLLTVQLWTSFYISLSSFSIEVFWTLLAFHFFKEILELSSVPWGKQILLEYSLVIFWICQKS